MIGLDDVIRFGLRWGPHILLQLTLLIAGIALWVVACSCKAWPNRIRIALLSIIGVGLVAFSFICVSIAKREFLVSLLAGEDERLVEVAYEKLAPILPPDYLFKIVHSSKENDNTRFYAACLLADCLVGESPTDLRTMLARIETAPSIRPRFFGTNEINEFFGPQELILPEQVVIMRLEEFSERSPITH